MILAILPANSTLCTGVLSAREDKEDAVVSLSSSCRYPLITWIENLGLPTNLKFHFQRRAKTHYASPQIKLDRPFIN